MKQDHKALLTRDVTLKAPLTFPDGTPEGTFLVRFSVFNKIDSQGDVMLPGSIPNGQSTTLVWSHDWDVWVGDGLTEVDEGGANLSGMFWMDTVDGEQAYRKVKHQGDRQEYSFGFRVTDASFGEFEGQPVRFVKSVELFEVSPVLIGAMRDTGTVALKQDPRDRKGPPSDRFDDDSLEVPDPSTLDEFEALSPPEKVALYYACLESGVESEKAEWSTSYVNSLPDSAFALIEPGGTLDDEGKTTPRSLRHFPHHDRAGNPDAPHVRNGLARAPQASTLTQAQRDRATAHLRRHANAMDIGKGAQSPREQFADHLERVLDEVVGVRSRAAEIRRLRADNGRSLSAATIERLTELRGESAALDGQLESLIAQAPHEKGDHDDDGPSLALMRLRHEHDVLRQRLRAEGVAT